MRKLIITLVILFSSTLLSNAAETPATTAAIDTEPIIAAYKSFYDAISQKQFSEAFQLLSTPTRTAFDRMASIMKRIDILVKAMPDSNIEKASALLVIGKFNGVNGPGIFTNVMTLTLEDAGGSMPAYQAPKEMKVAGTFASGKTVNGGSISMMKESGKWKVDLNSTALSSQCSSLEEYLKQLEGKK